MEGGQIIRWQEIFEAGQQLLRDTFGMQLVALTARDRQPRSTGVPQSMSRYSTLL